MIDKSTEHLMNVATNGREQRQQEAAAVRKLVALSDASKREPEHKDNDAVMFLAGLTNAELRNQNRS